MMGGTLAAIPDHEVDPKMDVSCKAQNMDRGE